MLTVRDLAASRQFYSEVIGLILTAEEDGTLYFRGVEEACHHSLVLRKAKDVSCARIGLRVFTDADLESLKTFFETRGCPAAWADVPHQGRTLHATDPAGTPLEFCAVMPVVPRMITKFTRHAGGSALRLDHYQILTPGGSQDLRVLYGGRLPLERIYRAVGYVRPARRVFAAQGQSA